LDRLIYEDPEGQIRKSVACLAVEISRIIKRIKEGKIESSIGLGF
jgi:hypothetical protein